MNYEWEFEAINLPPGCWVDDQDGYVMLPGGTVIGRLTPDGLRRLEWYLADLPAVSPAKEGSPE